jgi:DNA primase
MVLAMTNISLRNSESGRFRRELLPPAKSFYEQALGELRRAARSWARPKTGCPFHESKSKSSFAVNLDSGGFFCFSCGAKGGSVIDFLMLRDGLTFKEASILLGCWDEYGRPPQLDHPRLPLIRFLAWDFTLDGHLYRASVRDEPRDYADLIRRFYRESSDRLTELGRGDFETNCQKPA